MGTENAIRAGDRVTFRRGMFGEWSGTVASVYQGRAHFGLWALVRYARKNGSRGEKRCPVECLTKLVAP